MKMYIMVFVFYILVNISKKGNRKLLFNICLILSLIFLGMLFTIIFYCIIIIFLDVLDFETAKYGLYIYLWCCVGNLNYYAMKILISDTFF